MKAKRYCCTVPMSMETAPCASSTLSAITQCRFLWFFFVKYIFKKIKISRIVRRERCLEKQRKHLVDQSVRGWT